MLYPAAGAGYAAGMDIFRLFKRRAVIGTGTGLDVLLRAGGPLRLARARGCRILCTAGCAWITAPGVAADIYLKAGEAWDVGCDGLVLIEAADCATVRMQAWAYRMSPST